MNIFQFKIDIVLQAGYSFKISLNGIVVSEIENPKPETYSNVKVYAAGKYVRPSNAWIRNFQASTSIDSKITTSFPFPTVTLNMETVPPITTEMEEPPSITQTLIQGKGKKVEENTLIGSFDKWWPTFKIKFEVKVDSFGSKPGFLLLFTSKNGDCRFSCSSGQYIPAVFTRK